MELAELRKKVLHAALTMHGLSPEAVNSSTRCKGFLKGDVADVKIDEAAITEEAQKVAELEAQEAKAKAQKAKAIKSRRKLLKVAFKKVGLEAEALAGVLAQPTCVLQDLR